MSDTQPAMNNSAQLTTEQHNALHALLARVHQGGFAEMPPTDQWPDLGVAYSVNPMQVKGGMVSFAKFERSITLANGRTSKKVGIGATRRLDGCISIEPMHVEA